VNVLVVDIGGTHVKLLATGETRRREFDSGAKLTAAEMVENVKKLTSDWAYDVVAMGYPGKVSRDRVIQEPANLGRGWINFDFAAAFDRPIRVVNDAAMQALGSYQGGRMLFLGLGTGLGSAMIVDGAVAPMELAHLPYKDGRTYEEFAGVQALERMGKKKWRAVVAEIVTDLVNALLPEDVVLGGGNARLLREVPAGARRVTNANAFLGGFRLWEPAHPT
jgi:polyphosphate glucokinase